MSQFPYDLTLTEGQSFKVIPFEFLNVNPNEVVSKKYTISTGWNFILAAINANPNTGFKFNIYNAFTGESVFTDMTDGITVTGDGKLTFIAPKPYLFRQTEPIEIRLMNTTSSVKNYFISLIGVKDVYERMFRPREVERIKYKFERLYVLPFDFVLSPGATLSLTKSISKEFDFQWEMLNSIYTRDYTIQIRDSFVNEDFFEGNVFGSLITGDGKLPFILPRPYVFKGGTNIKVTVSDTGTTGNNIIQVTMIGYKIKRL